MRILNRHSIFILLSTLCLTLAGCSGGDDYNPNEQQNTPDNPDEKKDTLSRVDRPTDWVRVTTSIDPFTSLSLTVKRPDLSQYAAPADSGSWEGDLMATFVGGTCRGVSEPFDDGSVGDSTTTENIIFLLPVVGLTTDDADANKTVTLKYYSARLHHVFTATSPYPLKNDVEAYGTRTSPLILTWTK